MGWIIGISIGIFIIIFAVIMNNIQEKKILSKASDWACPACNRSFGKQNEYRGWFVRAKSTRKLGYFRADSGLILHCNECDKDFTFTRDGKNKNINMELEERKNT